MTPEQIREFGTDVVFVGHYEPDERLEYLEQMARQGIAFRLFGPGYDWNPVLEKSALLSGHIPVRLVWGGEYNLALAGAKIALCFLSKLNRDTYTRRCFEIPATGTMLLSEYSEDLAEMFEEGVEADYFRNSDEMISKIMIYLGDDSLRQRVASAGRARLLRDGHDVDSRVRQLLAWADSLASEKRPHSIEGHPMTETIDL
jgi:glycosyltransferase involved in cell wall biosynthesis